MGYDIIKKVAELSLSGLRLDAKLARAARFILDDLPYEQCVFYILDPDGKAFVKRAFAGVDAALVCSYGATEGLPGLVKKKKGPVEAYKADTASTAWEGVDDAGLKGYKSALAYPLRDKETFFGVIYLKSARKASLSKLKRRALGIIALQASSFIKCADLAESHERIHRDLLKIEERLASSEKLMALGDMAATLAHEIRNPLLSIGGFAGRLKKHLGPGSPGIPYVEQVLKEVVRLEKLMNGVTGFIKDSAVSLKPDDLNVIIEEVIALFDDEFKAHNIAVQRDLAEGAMGVAADREQLKIAFDNLIVNAIQSMEHGGALRISTSHEGGRAVVSIADSGGGIEPGNLGYIFNPFFTTKAHGTGLGLPITNSIILRHKGSIEVENNPGVGVTFRVTLPYLRQLRSAC